jgi:hypothetical protein
MLLPALLGLSYAATLAPTITWAHDGGDGGDLIAAAYTLGIAHPPGYPAYVLLGKLFTLLPLGDVAYRLNLMSAVAALVAAGALYLALVVGARVRPLAALSAALCLGWSPLVWSQAVIAEVYAPALACVALVWLLAVAGGPRARMAAAVVLGLGLGVHLSLLLIAPALVWLAGRSGRPSRQEWLGIAAALLLGAAVYLYIPLRAAQWPPVDWGAPVTLERFWWLVSGQLYRGYLFGLPLADWPARLLAWTSLLVGNFTPLGLLLALVGILSHSEFANAGRSASTNAQSPHPETAIPSQGELRDLQNGRLRATSVNPLTHPLTPRPRWRIPLALTFVAYSLFALGYNTTDSYVYLLPAWFAVAFALGLGADELLAAARSPVLRVPAIALLLALPAWLGWQGLGAQDLHSDRAARDYGVQVLDAVAPGAVLVAGDERHVFTLWYLRAVEQRRPDVAIVATGLVGYDWYREHLERADPSLALPDSVAAPGGWASYLRQLATRRPVYLADADAELLRELPARAEGVVWRVEGAVR